MYTIYMKQDKLKNIYMVQDVKFLMQLMVDEGFEQSKINSWIERYVSIKEFLPYFNLKDMNAFDFFKIVCIGEFISGKFNNDKAKAKVIIYFPTPLRHFSHTTSKTKRLSFHYSQIHLGLPT